MKKYIINLERREDRRVHFIRNNSFLRNQEFLIAVDKEDITLEYLAENGLSTNPYWRDPFRNRRITKGEVACFLSHAKAWKTCVELNEPIMVFEDDAIVKEELFVEEYYEEVLKQYGFLYLSRRENEPEKVEPINDKLERPSYPYNMTSYCLTPETALLLLNSGIMQSIIPVDEFLPKVIRQINGVALIDDVADQVSRNILGSDIEPYSEDDWFIDFKVHPITVGTDRKKCVALNTSGMMVGIYPKNLGETAEWKGGDMTTPGGGTKVRLLKEYLARSELNDWDVILFTDAYDVFYVEDLQTITKRYIGFNKKVIFSAERYCYPDNNLVQKYPQSDTPYRFLNSGTFIGQVGELKKIIGDGIDHSDDDQLFYTQQFLSDNFDIALDYEGYIFQTHEPQVTKVNDQIYNPLTRCYGCIYHGNGGEETKSKFDELYNAFYPKAPSLFIPTYSKFDILEKDMLIVNFMTQSQCEDLIDMADRHGGWEPHPDDKFPAQEIRLKELGLWEECESHWQKHIYPIVEEYWSPMQMYGLREAFVMRYALDTQVSLSNHCDASMVTGSVKLNDDYEGAELYYHRQKVSNKDVPVGRAILFPGQVTHGHECQKLISGVKYSLTMWTQRYKGDLL